MTPTPLRDARSYVEQVQSSLPDPAERDRALAVCERELDDLLGTVRTYRNDAKLQQEGDAGSNNGQA